MKSSTPDPWVLLSTSPVYHFLSLRGSIFAHSVESVVRYVVDKGRTLAAPPLHAERVGSFPAPELQWKVVYTTGMS